MADGSSIELRLVGVTQARRVLGSVAGEQAVSEALEAAATIVREFVISRTPRYDPVKGERVRHPPGTAKQSWTEPQRVRPNLYTFESSAPWTVKLEEGSYHPSMVVEKRRDGSPGRLVAKDGGVWSKSAVGGIVGPVLADRAKLSLAVQAMIKAYNDVIRKFT